MKLRIASRDERQFKSIVKRQDQLRWHVHFAWLPVRFDKMTMVWLERVSRRRSLRDGTRYTLWRFSYYRPAGFEYGPIHNVLMQPGVDVNVTGSAGVSAAQAGSSTIQGRLAATLGEQLQSVHASGYANDGNPPPGGLNTIASKLGT